jgi:hypothetical protein
MSAWARWGLRFYLLTSKDGGICTSDASSTATTGVRGSYCEQNCTCPSSRQKRVLLTARYPIGESMHEKHRPGT